MEELIPAGHGRARVEAWAKEQGYNLKLIYTKYDGPILLFYDKEYADTDGRLGRFETYSGEWIKDWDYLWAQIRLRHPNQETDLITNFEPPDEIVLPGYLKT